MNRKPRGLVVATMVLGALVGCSKDATGPGSVNFPAFPAQVNANFCIRGNVTSPDTMAGQIETTDCPWGDGSFYEAWRVRVGATGNYKFLANSTLDNYLAVIQVDSFTTTQLYGTPIGQDDDSGGGVNALVTVNLLKDKDYVLLVDGFDSLQLGPYTVGLTKP